MIICHISDDFARSRDGTFRRNAYRRIWIDDSVVLIWIKIDDTVKFLMWLSQWIGCCFFRFSHPSTFFSYSRYRTISKILVVSPCKLYCYFKDISVSECQFEVKFENFSTTSWMSREMRRLISSECNEKITNWRSHRYIMTSNWIDQRKSSGFVPLASRIWRSLVSVVSYMMNVSWSRNSCHRGTLSVLLSYRAYWRENTDIFRTEHYFNVIEKSFCINEKFWHISQDLMTERKKLTMYRDVLLLRPKCRDHDLASVSTILGRMSWHNMAFRFLLWKMNESDLVNGSFFDFCASRVLLRIFWSHTTRFRWSETWWSMLAIIRITRRIVTSCTSLLR